MGHLKFLKVSLGSCTICTVYLPKIPKYGSCSSLLIYLHRDINAYIVIKAVNRADAVMILNEDKKGIAQKSPQFTSYKRILYISVHQF